MLRALVWHPAGAAACTVAHCGERAYPDEGPIDSLYVYNVQAVGALRSRSRLRAMQRRVLVQFGQQHGVEIGDQLRGGPRP